MSEPTLRAAAQAFLDHVAEAATWPTPGIGCDAGCKQADRLRAALAASDREAGLDALRLAVERWENAGSEATYDDMEDVAEAARVYVARLANPKAAEE